MNNLVTVEVKQQLGTIESNLDEEEPFNIDEVFDPMDCEEPFVVNEEVKYVQVILTAPVKDWSYLLQVAEQNGWKWEAYDGE